MVQVLVVCLAALGVEQSTSEPKSEPRPFHAIHGEISDLLRHEAQAKEPSARADVVRRMCELHGEILRDSRFATSDTLAEYRIRLWSRLRRVQAELKQQIARSSDKHDKQAAEDYATLAAANSASIVAAESLAESLALLDLSQGGPGYLVGFGGRAVPPDFGQDLVDLIEQTINPEFWDTNGGPGTIVYYAPLRCIVVRATSEVHGNVGGLVGGLRAAGK